MRMRRLLWVCMLGSELIGCDRASPAREPSALDLSRMRQAVVAIGQRVVHNSATRFDIAGSGVAMFYLAEKPQEDKPLANSHNCLRMRDKATLLKECRWLILFCTVSRF